MGDHYTQKFEQTDYKNQLQELMNGREVSREEFNALKKEIKEMKEILAKAAKYDIDTNQPHCETEDKVALLKKVAELFGVDLSEIFKK